MHCEQEKGHRGHRVDTEEAEYMKFLLLDVVLALTSTILTRALDAWAGFFHSQEKCAWHLATRIQASRECISD